MGDVIDTMELCSEEQALHGVDDIVMVRGSFTELLEEVKILHAGRSRNA